MSNISNYKDLRWSFSSLKEYVSCPRKYNEIKVLKNFVPKQSKEMADGNYVHKLLERYVKDGIELPSNYIKYLKYVNPLLEGDENTLVFTEKRLAVTADKKPCKFNGKNYWACGIIDLLIIEDDVAFIVDYKTGKDTYPDTNQLKLMTALTFVHYPQIDRIKSGLLFLNKGTFINKEYIRDNLDELWDNFTPALLRLAISHENDTWQPNPTPLCGWCSVKTCEYNN
jgi:CRISPR/Cas system-associated exonuclease Cas4 (RecB family)